MPNTSASAPAAATPAAGGQSIIRVHVFVDFWNYELSMKGVEKKFPTDWIKMPQVLTAAAGQAINPGLRADYQGMNVYGSFNDDGRDSSFKKWFTTVLDTFPGVNVHLVPRQKKRTGPKCPHCYAITEHCPHCGKDMRGTEEKGVDTRIVTDMISLAWEQAYDVAVLVSSDRDFVPVAEYLQSKGIKVMHGKFPPVGSVLTQKCWGSIDIPSLRSQFKR